MIDIFNYFIFKLNKKVPIFLFDILKSIFQSGKVKYVNYF
jgi:hypothetical protein